MVQQRSGRRKAKRSSEVMEILYGGLVSSKMEPGHSPPLILFWRELLDRSLTNTHTPNTCPQSPTHMLILPNYTLVSVFLTEIEVTSQQSHCKSIHVAPNETPTLSHTRIQFPVSGLAQSPNHSVTPPLLGSSFCLCFSSSMNFSCISSMEPSDGFRSFSGKMSGKVNVWP